MFTRFILYLLFSFISLPAVAYQVFYNRNQVEVLLDTTDYQMNTNSALPENTTINMFVSIRQTGNINLATLANRCGKNFNTLSLTSAKSYNTGTNTKVNDFIKNVLKGPLLVFTTRDLWRGSDGQSCLAGFGVMQICMEANYKYGNDTLSLSSHFSSNCAYAVVPPANLSCSATLTGGNIDIKAESGSAWEGASDISINCDAKVTAKIELKNVLNNNHVELIDSTNNKRINASVSIDGSLLTASPEHTVFLNKGVTLVPVKISGSGFTEIGEYSGELVLSITYI
ncbi:MAG: hypothetical protein LBR63_14895 [Citrobacter amalonaticus]|jgi:hypothetical protein|nr:hypothetical protein [Citrobacter amalonaticus]